jgi:L-cysteine desulfidase
MNMALAEAGLSGDWGMRIGKTLLSGAPGGDLLWRAKAYSAAAADARMDGANLPAMSSAGSGNHGIVALIPPALAAADMGKSARELAEAVALSHLVTGYIKARTGRLTPICGCSVAAGAGAASALVRLSGGDRIKAEAAAANVLASLLGMICDGAKAGCALKVATAAGEAVTSAFLALHGAGVTGRDGVLGLDISANSRAVGEISKIGFGGVDHVLLGLMGRNS